MPDQRSPFDVGFADFVAVLLVETLESIVAAHTSQEEKLASLRAAAGLTVEEFASTAITVESVDETAAQLFPDDEGGTTLVVKGPIPEEEALDELQVGLESGDTSRGGLTDAGVARIRDALALYLAGRQLAAVREANARGIPRVYVEGGTLRAKLNFTAVDTGSDRTATPAAAPATPASGTSGQPSRVILDSLGPGLRGDLMVNLPGLPAGALRHKLIAWDSPLQAGVLDSIRRTRLVVSTPPPSTGDGEPGPTTRTEVFGEVEIRFRTEE